MTETVEHPAPAGALHLPFGPDYLLPVQYFQLVAGLIRERTANRKESGRLLTYMEQADIRAHLTRVFGYGRWDEEVLASGVVFVEDTMIGPKADKQGKPLEQRPGFEVTCTSTVRLTVRSVSGRQLCVFTEVAAASNAQTNKGAAYETALKSATSDALKRCAINLGDQFGLGLYRKENQFTPMVRGSIVEPARFGWRPADEPEPERKEVSLQHPVEVEDAPAPAVSEEDPDAAAIEAAYEADQQARQVTDIPYAEDAPPAPSAAELAAERARGDAEHQEEAIGRVRARIARDQESREF